MSTLLQMASDIVAAQASSKAMSTEEVVTALSEVHKALAAIEKGAEITPAEAETEQPQISRKKAFGRDKIYCMICGKGMKTLSRHLRTNHDMTPGDYRKQFDIPRSQALAAKNYSESRRQMAVERGLGENLAKARAARGKGRKKKA